MRRLNIIRKKFGDPRSRPRRIRLLGRGLRLAGQRGGCKMYGKGLSIAGQHGGGLNLRQVFNHAIANPAKHWYHNHKRELNSGFRQASNIAGQILPFAMLATL